MSARPEPSVLWREGMLLCPQHLQAFSRELRARIVRAESLGLPGSYGLIALEIDAAALERDVFQVVACDALLRDGTWLRLPENAHLEPREFGDHWKQETLDVWIGIAAEQPGVPQIGDDPERAWRYRAQVQSVADENERDGERELEFRQLEARLFFGGEDRTGFECLRLARLERRGRPVPKSALLEHDVPPLLACGASQALMRQLKAIAVATRAQARDLARSLPLATRASDDRSVDVLAFAKLQAIGRATALLEQLAGGPQLHPFEAWRTLVDLIGTLAIFGPDRVPPADLPAYDHEKLGDGFRVAFKALRSLLATEVTLPYDTVDFAADPLREGFFQVELPADWLDGDHALYLAVESTATPEATVEYVANCVKLIGAGDVESFLTGVVPGIELVHEKVAPVAFPASAERHWFRIEREGASREAFLRALGQKRLALLTFLQSIGGARFRLFVELQG
ncbi:MAG: type VI secretion system baseplate subunit TssK [Planctomycetes bacterium]|nr:type VI secretion system baseplate subunit TssK [Planctomycetota bacterium]